MERPLFIMKAEKESSDKPDIYRNNKYCVRIMAEGK